MRRRFLQLCCCAGFLLGLLVLGRCPAAEPAPENVALQIDGARGTVELPSNLFDGLTEATFEGWFRWDRLGYFAQPVAFGEEWHSAGIDLQGSRAEVQFYLYPESGAPCVVRAAGAVRLGGWTHLATVFGRTGIRFYVNGVLAGTNAQTGMPRGGHNSLGRAAWADNEPFFGLMDELRLWRVARSAEQINATLGQRLTGREPGLVALWNFDRRTADSAGTNGFHGRIAGEVSWTDAVPPAASGLVRPAIIAGKVVNAAGQAVAGAEVGLSHGDASVDRVASDAAGEFIFVVLAGGTFGVTASAGETGASRDVVEVAAGQRRECVLTLEPAVSIAGHVHARDGTPQGNAVVQAMRVGQDGRAMVTAMTRSRGEGRFAFVNLPPGTYRLRCSSILTNDYLPRAAGTVCTTGERALDLEVRPGRPAGPAEFNLPLLKRGLWRQYTLHEGLADNRVTGLDVGADDALWIATAGGLSRFDGNHFRNYLPADGLPSLSIGALKVGRDGTLWLGTGAGLVRFDGTKFTLVEGTGVLVRAGIHALEEDSQGGIWVAADTGVHRWFAGQWTHLGTRDGLGSRFANDLCAGTDGSMWLAGRGGLSRWVAGKVSLLSATDGLQLEGGVQRVFLAEDRSVWCGGQGTLVRLEGGERPAPLFPLGFRERVNLIQRTRAGASWIGVFNDGIYRCADERVLNYDGTDLSALPIVTSLAETHDGRLWFGTFDSGLASLDETSVVNYSPLDGLPSRLVTGVARDSAGRLWVAAKGATVARLDGEHFEILPSADGLPHDQVNVVKTGPDGRVWLATATGLARVTADGLRVEGVDPSFTARIAELEFGTDGEVLMGTDGHGLMSWNGNRIESANARLGFSRMFPAPLFRDRSGALWQAGLPVERVAGKSRRQFAQADGLSGQVTALAEGPAGTLWAGTEHGLLSFRDDHFTELPVASPLGRSSVNGLATAPDGHVWVGSMVGLGVFDGTAWSTLDARDGLLGDAVRGMLREKDGTLWLWSESGLTRLQSNRAAPRAAVDRVESEGQMSDPAGQPRLLADRVATFQFASTDFKTHPAKRQFRHRFRELAGDGTGPEPPWSASVADATLRWTPPRPGRYRLEVQAIDRDLNYSPPAQLDFSAAWPWHRNPWVIGPVSLAVLLLAGLAAGYGWRYSVHRREALALRYEMAARERAEQEHRAFARQLIETQEAERKRIAAELHDGLGQNLLVVKGRTTLALALPLSPEVREHVQEISAVTVQSLAEAREISHNLRPHQLDSLGLAKAVRAMARKVCEAARLKLEIEVDDLVGVLAATQEIQLYRVAQEALNNVAKHSGATTVWLSLRRGPERVTLEIRDDGRGFVRPEIPRTDGGGFGLVTMQERMNLIGGTLVLDSTPGAGTRLVAEVPLAGS